MSSLLHLQVPGIYVIVRQLSLILKMVRCYWPGLNSLVVLVLIMHLHAYPEKYQTMKGRTWRYSDWLWVDGEIWIYAEVSNENNSHEIRLFRIPIE